MRNNYFQFKQFTVAQDHCAMKVSTDACIQGAWTPIPKLTKRIVDVGTGTGLLALMLAQRCEQAQVEALEVNDSAFFQASENFSLSPWNSRLSCILADARNFTTTEQVDLIICNPPFFSNSLKSPNPSRTTARHNDSFSLLDLFSFLNLNLQPSGVASILLPASEHKLWEALVLKQKWFFQSQLLICPKEGQEPNRIVSICCKQFVESIQTTLLTIRDSEGKYTTHYKELMQPFYLFN